MSNIKKKKNLPEMAVNNLDNINLTQENADVKSEVLTAEHKSDFYKSGISDETLNPYIQEGYVESQENGWKLYYPELLENVSTNYYTFRFDNPPEGKNGKKLGKYKRPAGETSRIFRPLSFTPTILEDIKQPIIIVEGEKKAIKAEQEGFNCLAISGVWCWKSKYTDDTLIPDLHKIKWEGRKVYLCFDNDIVVKSQVKQALFAFMEVITLFGAIVRPVYLPACNEVNKKLGLDDYLMDYGAEEFQKLIDNARIPANLLLDKFITKKNEDFGKKNEYEYPEEYSKDFEYLKSEIYVINNNYYDIEISRDSRIIKAIRKSNFIIRILREVKNHNLKFGYETEFKVKMITILDGFPTKEKILSVDELFNYKNLSEILKSNGIHQYHLKELEYKNIIRKELFRVDSRLNSFENPGFNVLDISKIWLTKNFCFDFETKRHYTSDSGKPIKFFTEEVCLKTGSGFLAPKIKFLLADESIDEITNKFPYLEEVKSEYQPYIKEELTSIQLIAISMLHNILESYNNTIEPFLILGIAILSPFVAEIFDRLQGYPIGFAGGESQSGKSNLLITIAYLYGFKHNFLKSGNDTPKNILHNLEYYSKIPVLIQETGKFLRDRIEDMLVKPVYDRTGRGLMFSGEEQNIKAINSTLIIASNDVIHRNLQTSSRLIFTDWKKDDFDKNKAKLFNQVRETLLSAIFPSVLSIEPDEILRLLNHNIEFIEKQNFNIDTRSISNIALAKTGMDFIVKLTGLDATVPALKILQDKYAKFLENYNEAVSVKDSFEIFLEIFELLVRDGKVAKNIDWKLVNNDSYLAIHLKSVYPRFKEYFKRTHDSIFSIPSEKDIRNGAKKRGFDTNYPASFGSTTKKTVRIVMDSHEHLLSVLKSIPDSSNSSDSSNLRNPRTKRKVGKSSAAF